MGFGQKIPTGAMILHKEGLSSGCSETLSPPLTPNLFPNHWVNPHLGRGLLSGVQGAFVSTFSPSQHGPRGHRKPIRRHWHPTCDPVPPLTVSPRPLTSGTLFSRRGVCTFVPHSWNNFLNSSHASCSLILGSEKASPPW